MTPGRYSVRDTTFSIHRPLEEDWLGPDALKKKFVPVFRKLGFSIAPDESVPQTIRKSFWIGRWKELEVVLEWHANRCSFEFFQNVVIENRNGGRYDFNKRSKMPYLIGKRFEYVIRTLTIAVEKIGLQRSDTIDSAVPDPLAYFNDKWDSEWDKKRGVHRFRRGDDGWPTDADISGYNRKDADGRRLDQGDLRWCRDFQGYLRRGRIYGGINGRWIFIYGPGRHDFTHVSSSELFTYGPNTPRRVKKSDPAACRKRAFDRALKSRQFRRAALIGEAIERLDGQGELDTALGKAAA